MRPVYSIITFLSVMPLIGCAEFPTAYSRIEPEKARLLDFIYEPAEAAPGDTVLLKAVFAGKPVEADDLTWRMSRKVIVNQYGVNTALDTVPLEIVPQACAFSDRTSCIAFTFVIPENIIAESPLIPDDWTALIPEYYRKHIPPSLSAMSKSQLLGMVDNLSSSDALSSLPIDDEVSAMLPILLQCFTVPMRIYCTVKNDHTILSGYSVRYNRRFASVPRLRIPVNRNPHIDSVGVYAVHAAQLASFDPAEGKHSFDYIPISDSGLTEIIVDDNTTYFTAAFVGDVDSTLSIDAAMGNGKPLPEQFVTQWYLEFDNDEMDEVSPFDLMQISGNQLATGHYISRLYPSKNSAVTACTAWLEVRDRFLNEYHRPQGSTLREMRLSFTYTEEYVKNVIKK